MRQSKIIHRSEFETSKSHTSVTDTGISGKKDYMYSTQYTTINGKEQASFKKLAIGNPYETIPFNSLSVNLYEYNDTTHRSKEMTFDLSSIEQAKALLEVIETFIAHKSELSEK